MILLNYGILIDQAADLVDDDEQRIFEFVVRRMPEHALEFLRQVRRPVSYRIVVVTQEQATEWMPSYKGPACLPWLSAEFQRATDAAMAAARDGRELHAMVDEHGTMLHRSTVDASSYASGDVLDWLRSLDEENPKLLDKLWKMTWKQALEHTTKWHAALAKRQGQSAGDTDTTDRVHSHDGHYWCRLISTSALDREGLAMGHCVGTGGYDEYAHIPLEQGGIWSLRAPDGTSVLTAELRLRMGISDELTVAQVQGRANASPTPVQIKHFPVLRAALKARDIEIYSRKLLFSRERSPGIGNTQYFDEDGTAVDVDGFRRDGNPTMSLLDWHLARMALQRVAA